MRIRRPPRGVAVLWGSLLAIGVIGAVLRIAGVQVFGLIAVAALVLFALVGLWVYFTTPRT
jgi:Zn-dependent membrane protease YugP